MAGGTTGVGTGGMATKLRAALIATQGGADVVIANGRVPRTLEVVAAGEPRGTLIPAASDRIESRKRWILGNISRTGHLVVDEGAVSAPSRPRPQPSPGRRGRGCRYLRAGRNRRGARREWRARRRRAGQLRQRRRSQAFAASAATALRTCSATPTATRSSTATTS